MECRGHFEQAYSLGLGYAGHRYTGHHGHYFGYLVLVDTLAVFVKFLLPLGCGLVEFFAKGLGLVAPFGRGGVVRCFGGVELVLCGLGYLVFELFDFLRHLYVGYMSTRAGFVKSVNGLVGKIAVADVAVG